jgi:hypothetical protein
MLIVLLTAALAAGPRTGAAAPTPDACADLAQLDLQGSAGAPGRVTSARPVDVLAGGLEGGRRLMAGLGGRAVLAQSPIKQYCEVTGYVAPHNKFILRLPSPAGWNHKFLFSACAGLCGVADATACNPGLARGYASVTSNGGHDGVPGFDGIWAASAPNLQEDFGWRSNHVVTLVAKDITTRYYGQPIERSYMVGCSKGGHAALMEAQRFPEDYDGLLPAAPVYDLTGRVIAGAWFAQAVDDGRGGSVLDPAAAEAVHASVSEGLRRTSRGGRGARHRPGGLFVAAGDDRVCSGEPHAGLPGAGAGESSQALDDAGEELERRGGLRLPLHPRHGDGMGAVELCRAAPRQHASAALQLHDRARVPVISGL